MQMSRVRPGVALRALWHVGDKIAATSDCVNHMQQDASCCSCCSHVAAASTLACAARTDKFFDLS